MFQEVGNDVGAMPLGVLGLEVEAGIFLVALRRKAHIVELNFVGTGLSSLLGQRYVVLLYLWVRRISPDQLAVFTPGLTRPVRHHREFGMHLNQSLVAEDGDPGDGVHVLRVQKANELGQIVERRMMTAQQRMI